jgi:cytochrome c553
MKQVLALLAFAACVCVGAAEPDAKPNLSKGQSIVTQVCAACHGLDGNSTGPANPKLAGQIPDYLQKQLTNYKAEQGKKAERENPVMGGMAASLSPEDMRSVAAYYGRQQLTPGAAKNKDTLALGQKIWRAGDAAKGLPACAACHGAAGAGTPSQYPRLAGQFVEYTEAQLKAFRSGERANDANRVMRAIAVKMSDLDIRAVADFAAGMR